MSEIIKKSIVVVLGIIKNKDGEVLVSLRNDPRFPGAHLKWDIIGGKNEMGESLEETIIREAKEETGLDIKVINLMPRSICKNWDLPELFQHTLLFCFECEAISGCPKCAGGKILDIRWVKMEEALKLDLLFSARDYLEEHMKKIRD